MTVKDLIRLLESEDENLEVVLEVDQQQQDYYSIRSSSEDNKLIISDFPF